jgi:hypothetical protein
MKITPPANQPGDQAASVKRTPGSGAGALNSDGVGVVSDGRNFASVFDRIARPAEKSEGDKDEKQSDRKDAKSSSAERAESADVPEREQKARTHGDREDEGGLGGFGYAHAARELRPAAEVTNPRAILHIADLERIVAAIRTQVTASGREVTLELNRSVLEGLRIKLSADSLGRVTAELFAPSEGIKAQIDARAADLAGLLRARGVNLAELKSSLSAGAGGREGSSEQRPWAQSAGPTSVWSGSAASRASEAPSGATEPPDSTSSTYRA